MILMNKAKEEGVLSVLNNDILRLMTALNNEQEIKRLLIYTDKSPLSREADVEADLRDKLIGRIPLVPHNEEDSSICVISLVRGDVESSSLTAYATLSVDVFTPGNQWLIDEGIRPLVLSDKIQKVVQTKMVQTGGIKYRFSSIVSAQLTDVLMGYRMLFEVVLDD